MMKKPLILCIAFILFLLLGAFMFPAQSVLAQDPSPTPTPTQTSAPSAAGAATDTQTSPLGLVQPPQLSPTELMTLVGLTGVGILILWGSLFFYVGYSQKQVYDVTQNLAQRGISVSLSPLSTAFPKLGALGAMSSPPTQIEIRGPNSVTVGVGSKYQAFAVGAGDRVPTPLEVPWEIKPADIASLDKSTGSEVTVTAKRTGTFTLSVKLLDEQGKEVESQPPPLTIEAVSPLGNKVELPVFGVGYGAIGISIIVLGLFVILGLTGILSGDAIAGILGALIGYVFGVRTNDSGGKSGGQAPQGGGEGG